MCACGRAVGRNGARGMCHRCYQRARYREQLGAPRIGHVVAAIRDVLAAGPLRMWQIAHAVAQRLGRSFGGLATSMTSTLRKMPDVERVSRGVYRLRGVA